MNRVNIKEANAHLQKLYQRVQDLESTVQDQAEAMIRRDEEAETALRELRQSKDREIADLRKSIQASEGHAQQHMASCKDKDAHILLLKQRSKILDEICQELPSLEIVVGALKKTPLVRSRNASWYGTGTASGEGSPGLTPVKETGKFGMSAVHLPCSPTEGLQNSISRNFSISDDDDGS